MLVFKDVSISDLTLSRQRVPASTNSTQTGRSGLHGTELVQRKEVARPPNLDFSMSFGAWHFPELWYC